MWSSLSEPIWAIGTGKTATSAEADGTIGDIRRAIRGVRRCSGQHAHSVWRRREPRQRSEADGEKIDDGLIGSASLKAP